MLKHLVTTVAVGYLVKPFHFPELVARLRALARRGHETGSMLCVGELRLDLAAHRAWRGDMELRLTAREFPGSCCRPRSCSNPRRSATDRHRHRGGVPPGEAP